MAALANRGARCREALARLRGLCVFSDAFFIWHADPFATINGARLGRVPGAVPEWAETNAALGQVALLLSLTAARLGFVGRRARGGGAIASRSVSTSRRSAARRQRLPAAPDWAPSTASTP
jgi:hypothetical protein